MLYYKGLPPEYFTKPHTVEASTKLAKGTIYESWFDTLKASPWYSHFIDTNNFPTEESLKVYRKFGDLRNVSFSGWWKSTGYRIFAESVPFEDVQVIDFESSVSQPRDLDAHPSIRIDIPLNLSPQYLESKIKQLIRDYSIYHESYERWRHSTAAIHPFKDNNLNYQTITKLLDLYKSYIEQTTINPNLSQAQFTIEANIDSNALREYKKSKRAINLNQAMREKLANVTSDYLKRSRYLMANATEGIFPCEDPHRWAMRGTSIIETY